jgi:adenine-specific DNA-methyltransferase
MPTFTNIGNDGITSVIAEFKNLIPIKGYVYENFAPDGKYARQYFSNSNAMKIDAIRDQIERWKEKNLISDEEYNYLVYCLIDAADFVANISGTYGAYLKIWRSMALKEIQIVPPKIFNNNQTNLIYQEDANILIRKLKGTIVYLDPPYNQRQYASNFHLLESLAVWDKQVLYGKTGQRDYSQKKSAYSQKTNALEAFTDLIHSINSDYVILSYNNEGIISLNDILRILKKVGDVKEYKMDYRRFRTERDHEKRQYKKVDDKVVEHLFIVHCYR